MPSTLKRASDDSHYPPKLAEAPHFLPTSSDAGAVVKKHFLPSLTVKRSRCEPVRSIVQMVLGFSGGGTRIDYRDWMESLFLVQNATAGLGIISPPLWILAFQNVGHASAGITAE
jgi:hypothetical protein